ncbi:type I restriction enzyme, S subunit [Arthrobacter alpinus]|uniref:Type I restriction enzyme, S subunit n=1 Tax=Arthrobacter alpinus TaxID=656366 RepID=A0A1H5LPN4_9MICC|nr:restriction endonuclease subunit S [Arthrobacter alpinus]SEE79016.1 type I restriction enzyme, S subunit [Arthrobacter alpinus]
MTVVRWPAVTGFEEIAFGRIFEKIERPAAIGAPMVTAYTDGEVTLRSRRDKIGYHEAANMDGYQGVEPGDFAVHGLDILRGSVGISDSSGAITKVCSICRPIKRVDLRFVAHAIRAQARSGFIRAMARGIREGGADFRRWGTLAELPIPFPPFSEQQAIADYLDRETQQIDELIAEQHGLINTLRERREAVVDSVFGVHDANSRMYAACIDVVDCPHTTPEVEVDGGYEAVRTASVRSGRFKAGQGIRVSESTWSDRNAAGAPQMGDVLFTREAPAGEACMVPETNVCLGQRMVLLRVDHSRVEGRFLMWQIYGRVVQDYFRTHSNGSTVSNVRLPILRGLPIWLPSLDEQRKVAAYLDDQTSLIDGLIAESEDLITLSQERRAALITAAVTGQIKVRTVV